MYRIMVVDDEIMSQEVIKRYIETHLPKYHVACVCNNGLQALQCFEKNPSDIILVDIRMPLMNGIELISALSKRSDDFTPIIISGYAEFEYAKSAMILGVSHYLLKPLDFKELERSILAATHTLISKRKQRKSLNWAEENQEIFFSQLLSGQYPTQQDAISHFDALHLPIAYKAVDGVLLDIYAAPADNPLYESEELFSEIKQLLQDLYATPYIWMLPGKNFTCRYLLIGEMHHSICVNDIINKAIQSLEINLSVLYKYGFTSLEDLRTNESVFMPFSAEAEDIKKMDYNQSIESSIAKAVTYMNEHYAEDLTREMVAGKVFMSGAHFSRCFKMVMKKSYKDYLTELRMRKAIELLNTEARIQDIAKKVGYPNTNRFNINFKSYTSYTPSEYRRDVLKKHVN